MKCPKCGWQNVPGKEKCLQCGAPLTEQEIPTYPPRAKKKSRYSTTKRNRVRKASQRAAMPDIPGYLVRLSRTSARLASTVLPRYIRIIGMTIAGYIPALMHFIQRRAHTGWLLLTIALSLILLFAITLYNGFSNAMLILLAVLAIYSSYDVVVHYFKIKKYLLNNWIRTGVAITSISLFFLLRNVLIIIFNVFTITAIVNVGGFSPIFLRGDQFFGVRSQYLREDFDRGDLVVVRSAYHNVSTLARIIGIPGDAVSCTEGEVRLNGTRLDPADYQLLQAPEQEYQYSPEENHYIVITRTNRTVLEQIPGNNILGKVMYIINPPDRRGVVQ